MHEIEDDRSLRYWVVYLNADAVVVKLMGLNVDISSMGMRVANISLGGIIPNEVMENIARSGKSNSASAGVPDRRC